MEVPYEFIVWYPCHCGIAILNMYYGICGGFWYNSLSVKLTGEYKWKEKMARIKLKSVTPESSD